MIVFLYGKDSYSRTKKFIEVYGIYRERMGNAEAARFDFAGSAETADLESFLANTSIFGDKLFAVIENPFESKEKKELKKILEPHVEDKNSILIIVSDAEAPKSFVFLLEKPKASQGFPAIEKGKDLERFITTEAGKRGMKLTAEDVHHLSQSFGTDLWAIATELDKISLTESKSVERKSVHDYLENMNTLKFDQDHERRLTALETLLSLRGDEPARIFNGLSFGLFDGQKIGRLADYDVAIKSGKLDYEEALVDFSL
ncbi:MAG: hypothetical protein A3B23_01890 [Candidatus Colwellbacteria bacterium RIFCSPLOWO2_01_FULL_48_10]|uniref:DNA polymerase III delta N-terminal domain-containing protein n=1 Tax=Candidatus Colwellbacteria bacterium RIFCSPLOWO2_01_FULL_48_10 TaxID=1797690 RepID=A0A1G1Z712_9BACT|nr:MAG: hypothetical protein A3B23_01890 [Candidatus Colwellbacteria bacterium RIFCSPLOWO2_01_FULL_48_10]